MTSKQKKNENIANFERDLAFFKSNYEVEVKKLKALQETIKIEKKRLAVMQKLAEQHEANVIGADTTEYGISICCVHIFSSQWRFFYFCFQKGFGKLKMLAI